MKHVWCIFVVVVLIPVVVHAELEVCFYPGRPLGSQFTSRLVDPSKITEPECTEVRKDSGQTTAQLVLIGSTIRGAPAPKYLKVVGGLAVAMSPAEQDAVDTDIATKAAEAKTFEDEAKLQDFCSSATLAAVNTYLNTINASITTDIAAVTNIATAQAAMTTMKNQFGLAMQKMARCLIAIKKGAR
jgi:hypothetical protein